MLFWPLPNLKCLGWFYCKLLIRGKAPTGWRREPRLLFGESETLALAAAQQTSLMPGQYQRYRERAFEQTDRVPFPVLPVSSRGRSRVGAHLSFFLECYDNIIIYIRWLLRIVYFLVDVDHTRAENIKRGAQLEKIKIPPSQLRKTFQRSVDAIVSEVHKVFEYYQQNIGYDPIPKIFLSGGASRTYGLVSTMEADLGIPVEIVDPFLNIGAIDPKVFDMEYLRYIGPSMAVAVGLALRDEEDKETKD